MEALEQLIHHPLPSFGNTGRFLLAHFMQLSPSTIPEYRRVPPALQIILVSDLSPSTLHSDVGLGVGVGATVGLGVGVGASVGLSVGAIGLGATIGLGVTVALGAPIV